MRKNRHNKYAYKHFAASMRYADDKFGKIGDETMFDKPQVTIGNDAFKEDIWRRGADTIEVRDYGDRREFYGQFELRANMAPGAPCWIAHGHFKIDALTVPEAFAKFKDALTPAAREAAIKEASAILGMHDPTSPIVRPGPQMPKGGLIK